ncbi:MAG TPA: PilT/PilU family type 4a pilus ATPase [Thermoanaerobaculia bacterium]|jgi:twitching motility protein PilT
MWPAKRGAPAAEGFLAALRARKWKTDSERDEILRSLAALPDLAAEDVAWLAIESDVALRQGGLAMVKKFPYEEGSAALFPFLASKTEAVRRQTMLALEQLAGGNFIDRLKGFLEHPDPVVVHSALDYLKRSPNEKALPWIAKALTPNNAAPVRKKAFAIVEATDSPRVGAMALQALDDDDEELRFRAIQVLMKRPSEMNIAPLLKHCRNDSHRIQDAAIAALGPLLSASNAWNDEVLPLLSDSNPKVRSLASRIIGTQEPHKIAESFLRTFRTTYGPAKDRAVDALRELGPEFIRAFLDRAHSDDPVEKALAVSIAVTIRAPEAVPHCIQFLTDEDWWLRDRAALALAEIKHDIALPHLLKMLQNPESSLSAAAALGIWGTPKALPGLLEAYKQALTQKELRLEILDAFGKIEDPRIPALLASIAQKDPDPLVKEKAARAAAQRTGKAGVEAPGGRVFAPHDFAANPRPNLTELLRHARAVNASDLHIATGTVPQMRLYGRLGPLPMPPASLEQVRAWLDPLLADGRKERLHEKRQLDFCHKDGELGRFRTNLFYQRKGPAAVFRLVPYEIPNLTDIRLPESLWEITTYSQGLILVTGPAGCGKTTTLAALVDRINETQRGHILTVEDPIEYVHTNKESLVNQREVPAHTRSFAKALRQSLREDPDVILVGEMRDLETISLAITASETGHLVLATLHTTTASSTVDRIINAFPPDQQGQIRMMVSDSLKAVISQTLLPRRDGQGRVAAYEILRNTANVGGLIRDAKTFQIPTAIQTGSAAGMLLMDGALLQLVQDGTIDPRVAYDRATRKEALEPFLQAEEGATA